MSASESLVHSFIVIIALVLALRSWELEADRAVRAPLARLAHHGSVLALLVLLLVLGACADNLSPPPQPTPSCEELGCGGDYPLCEDPDGPTNPDKPTCACGGETCEPRAFDCCATYMPDLTAVAICGERQILPATCGQLVCPVNGGAGVLVTFCRPEHEAP